MMQHANRERIIEASCKGQAVDVGLNDVHIRQLKRRSIRSFNCNTQIDADDLACAPRRRELCVPALSATSFKHHFAGKEFGCDWFDPTEELFCVAFVLLDEVSPLPAETFSRRLLVSI